jgi:hypothetical protein
VILDAKTGGRIASMRADLLDIFYTNLQTDRIFLADKTGLIQCLRETQMEWPLVHWFAEVKEKERPEIRQEGVDEAGAKPAAKKPAAKPDDPFGGPNPFGGGAGGAGAKPNPFGGPNPFDGGAGGAGAKPNPFGGPNPFDGGAGGAGAKPKANPFGGDNDPFK